MCATYWRDGFGKDEVIQRIRPAATTEFLNNPHKGIVTFQRFAGDPLMPYLFGKPDTAQQRTWVAPPGAEEMEAEGAQYFPGSSMSVEDDRFPPSRVAYCRWAWRLLEGEKGKIRFDIIDRALDTAAARGQTMQLRLQPFIGPRLYECPEWYWQTGALLDPAANPAHRTPDHNDPLYLRHWGDHIRALGERYDGDERLESFDLSYGGGCGEGGGNCTPQTAHALAELYMDAFRRTPLLTQLGTEGCLHASARTGGRIGWRADCFGDVHAEGGGSVPKGLNWNHMNDMYPQEVARCDLAQAWRAAPVSLESCWSAAYWFENGWDLDWIIDQGLKYHLSTLNNKSMYIPEPWMDRIMSFCQRMGYWFFLQQMILPLEARAGDTCPVACIIDNKGVAPIYRPYRLALRFSQGKAHKVVHLKQDIRGWMPDLTYFHETFTFPPGLQRGEAKVSCAIVDGRDRPAVRLAVKAHDADGWHGLTSIDVLE